MYEHRYTDSWEHECINIWDMVSTQGWIIDDAFGGTGLYVTKIALSEPDDNDPFYIDNVYIGSSEDSCKYFGIRKCEFD